MSKNGLHRHYDRLSPEERFRLDVLAMARGDMQESERLVSSCPRASYTMTERGFGARWGGAESATLLAWIGLGEHLARLRTVDTICAVFPYQQTLSSNITFDAYFKGHESGSRHAWGLAGKSGAPPAWPDDGPDGELLIPDEDERDPVMERDEEELETLLEKYGGFLSEVLKELERRAVLDALTIWTGYAEFCAGSMSVAAEKVAAVVLAPAMAQIEDMKLRADRLGIEPDREGADEVREGLAKAWERRLERGV
jgi:hypothetical protein